MAKSGALEPFCVAVAFVVGAAPLLGEAELVNCSDLFYFFGSKFFLLSRRRENFFLLLFFLRLKTFFFGSKEEKKMTKWKKEKNSPPSAAPGSGPRLCACRSCTAPCPRRRSPAKGRRGEERRRRKEKEKRTRVFLARATKTGRQALRSSQSHCFHCRRRVLLLLRLRFVVVALPLGGR